MEVFQGELFLLGFNKCGTTSLHKFFRDQGLKSAHCWIGSKNLAMECASHVDVTDCHRAFSNWQVFSDFTFLKGDRFLEPLDMYPLWRKSYPNAYFILNDRHLEDWVKSRRAHKGGDFLNRYLDFSGLSECEAVDQWVKKFLAHRASVLSFFQGDSKFCHFMVGQDSIKKVVGFLSADYHLSADFFERRNARPFGG